MRDDPNAGPSETRPEPVDVPESKRESLSRVVGQTGCVHDGRDVACAGREDGKESDILHDIERRVQSGPRKALGRDRAEKLLDSELGNDECLFIGVLHARLAGVGTI